jgi:hypothetical protein
VGISVVSFQTPTGTLVATQNGSSLVAPFSVSATFKAPGGGSCSNGEYRQFVKGVFRRNGSDLVHLLCPPTLLAAKNMGIEAHHFQPQFFHLPKPTVAIFEWRIVQRLFLTSQRLYLKLI